MWERSVFIKENGETISKEVVSSSVDEEPVDRVIRKGTKARPQNEPVVTAASSNKGSSGGSTPAAGSSSAGSGSAGSGSGGSGSSGGSGRFLHEKLNKSFQA